MSDLVDRDEIEGIVGATREDYVHLARAVSAEQRVYILHSRDCLGEFPDLRDCPYSLALDKGLPPHFPEDEAVKVALYGGRLWPVGWEAP